MPRSQVAKLRQAQAKLARFSADVVEQATNGAAAASEQLHGDFLFLSRCVS
jgi:hypothetical protein